MTFILTLMPIEPVLWSKQLFVAHAKFVLIPFIVNYLSAHSIWKPSDNMPYLQNHMMTSSLPQFYRAHSMVVIVLENYYHRLIRLFLTGEKSSNEALYFFQMDESSIISLITKPTPFIEDLTSLSLLNKLLILLLCFEITSPYVTFHMAHEPHSFYAEMAPIQLEHGLNTTFTAF